MRYTIVILALLLLGCVTEEKETVRLRIDVENISDEQTYLLEDGTPLALALAPGVWAVSEDGASLFSPDVAASSAVERLAEVGDPTTLREASTARESGLVGNIENADYQESPILPGSAAAFVIEVREGERFELAMMLGVSNDTFLGTSGVDLLELLGDASSVDLTPRLSWWDAGTEVNEPLGQGSHQPSASPEIDAGDAEGGVVRAVTQGLPDLSRTVRVKVSRQ